MRNKSCLTASDAQKIVAACKVEAEKNKWNVSIAVVDEGGYLLHLERLEHFLFVPIRDTSFFQAQVEKMLYQV